MTQLKSFARAAACSAVVLLLASACGGKSFVTSNGGDDDDDGGSSQGGSTGQAGAHTTAGKGHAGSGSTGGSGNTGGSGIGGGVTAGAGGTAGKPGEECNASAESGLCDAYIPAWYHDPTTGICRPFVYGGCGGNANRYSSLADCQKACPGGAPNYDACAQDSDCAVMGTGCCGVCDGPDVTAHDLIAYNQQYGDFLQCSYALDQAPPNSGTGTAPPIACGACPPVANGAMKFFVPQCVQKQCVVTDLRASPVTACKTSSECKIRYGTHCCEGCGGGDLVGTRNDGSFEKLVCSSAGPIACDACAPQPPTGAIPFCSPQGRCDVAYATQ